MTVLVFAFTALYALIAAGVLVTAGHASHALGAFTWSWLGGALLLLWAGWFLLRGSRSRGRVVVFLFEGALLGSLALGLPLAATSYEDAQHLTALAHTEIGNVQDAVLHSPGGDPIGVRLSFNARFPSSAGYVVYPFLKPSSAFFERIRARLPKGAYDPAPLDLRVIKRSVTPQPQDPRGDAPAALRDPTSRLDFSQGVRYRFVFDLAPSYLRRVGPGGTLCIAWPTAQDWWSSKTMFRALIEADAPTHYEVAINGTPYGDIVDGAPPEQTAHAYDPHDFYASAEREHLPACNPALPIAY